MHDNPVRIWYVHILFTSIVVGRIGFRKLSSVRFCDWYYVNFTYMHRYCYRPFACEFSCKMHYHRLTMYLHIIQHKVRWKWTIFSVFKTRKKLHFAMGKKNIETIRTKQSNYATIKNLFASTRCSNFVDKLYKYPVFTLRNKLK